MFYNSLYSMIDWKWIVKQKIGQSNKCKVNYWEKIGHLYSGRLFAFFKFREMRNLEDNILLEICKIAKPKIIYRPKNENLVWFFYYFHVVLPAFDSKVNFNTYFFCTMSKKSNLLLLIQSSDSTQLFWGGTFCQFLVYRHFWDHNGCDAGNVDPLIQHKNFLHKFLLIDNPI